VEPTAGTLTASAPNLVGQQASSTTELCNAHIAQGKNESKDTEMGGLNTQDVTAGASGTVQGSIYSLTLAFRSKA
jgi:hypothetical protein